MSSASNPPSARPASSEHRHPRAFVVAHGVLKSVSLVLGLALTVLSLMAVVGLVTERFWIRLAVASVVALLVPALVVDRLLTEDDPRGKPGLATDVFALVWLSFSLVFVGLCGRWTGPAILREGDRIFVGAAPRVAVIVWWLGGADVRARELLHPEGRR